jgi:DNA-binding NarL/FixJ family response regulator
MLSRPVPPHTMADTTPISVLVATPKALIRESIGLALLRETDLQLIGEAADSVRAVGEVLRLRPTVAVLEADLGEAGAAEATAVIRDRMAETRVLVLGDAEDPGEVIEVLDAGASAYLTNDQPVASLATAIRAVARGEVVVSPGLLGPVLTRLLAGRRLRDEALRRLLSLSERERDVLALMVEGGRTASIGESLGISPQTAKSHIQKILSKLGVHARAEAVAFVTANDLARDLEERRPNGRVR